MRRPTSLLGNRPSVASCTQTPPPCSHVRSRLESHQCAPHPRVRSSLVPWRGEFLGTGLTMRDSADTVDKANSGHPGAPMGTILA